MKSDFLESDIRINDKIVLRPFFSVERSELIVLYSRWFKGSNATREFLSPRTPKTPKGIARFVELNRSHDSPSRYFLILYLHNPIGHVALKRVNELQEKAEVSIVIGEPAFWRRGIATQIGKIGIDVVSNRLGLRRVYAYVDPANVAARALLETLGFRKKGAGESGLLYDHVAR